jgi:hypothetical protein
MSTRESKIIAASIPACERISEGVVITFADQQSVLFDAGFLYEAGRHMPGGSASLDGGAGER